MLLAKLEMTGRFAAICGADTFGVAKPDPIIFRQTVAQAGGDLSRAIMVGNSGLTSELRGARVCQLSESLFGYTETPIAETEARCRHWSHARPAGCSRELAEEFIRYCFI